MMAFGDLPKTIRGLVIFSLYMEVIFQVFAFILSIELKNRLRICTSFVMTVLTYLLFNYLVKINDSIPLDIIIVAMAALAMGMTALYINMGKIRRDRISVRSYSDAFDKIPLGVMSYRENGLVRMSNIVMNDISEKLTGSQMRNGKPFWESLENMSFEGAIKGGDEPLVKLSDGRHIAFERHFMELDHETIYEITAKDISEEMDLAKELDEKLEAEKNINLRLKTLIKTIEYVTMNKERNKLKTDLHDDLGRSLLFAKRYCLNPDDQVKDEMLMRWKESIKHLISEDEEEWLEPYYVIKKQAELLGLNLEINGRLPEDPDLVPIVETAITTHMTNVLRHAGGKNVTVISDRSGGMRTIRLTNDGKVPEGEVKESGGLKNLRREVESNRGNMTVRVTDRFELILEFPGR